MTVMDSHGLWFILFASRMRGLQMKIALVLLALAVLAAGIVGLVIGLDKRGVQSSLHASNE